MALIVPAELWRLWDVHPGVVAGLGVPAAIYVTGWRRLRARVRPGRGLAWWRPWAAGMALAVLVVALLSPLDALADDLFSAHMVQHLLLLLVAPLLMVAAAPFYLGLWALSPRARRGASQWWRRSRVREVVGQLLRPIPVWTANVAILWFWHMPAAYDAAIRRPWVHAVEHASFLVSAFFFWWLLFRYTDPRRRMDRGAGVVYVVTSGFFCSGLGALITLSAKPWYAVHAHTTAVWGLTPLADQQLAGLIMWVPAGLVYMGVAALLFVQWVDGASRALNRQHPG